MGNRDVDNLTEDVERQIRLAIEQAAVVLYVVDARTGPVPLDDVVARRLRGIDKPVLLVANKCDYETLDHQVGEFYQFGFGAPLRVSAKQNRGRHDLFDAIFKRLPAAPTEAPPTKDETLKLAIVGKRNAGKSTFINALAEEERTIVSEVEGTTRDSVDVRFEKDGKAIIAIDTAGVRNRGKIKSDVDFYSLTRAERSIRRADVVLHLFDATKKISMVDKQLAGYVLEEFKPVIFVVNKWDLLKDRLATGQFGDYLRRTFPSLDFVPMAFVTAEQGRNVLPVLDLARNLFKQASTRATTGDLNRILKNALAAQSPPMRQNRVPKIYYATQVATLPPTIVLFTNGPDLFDKTYQRYLLKTFRDQLPFHDIAIKMYLRDKQRDEKGRRGGDDDTDEADDRGADGAAAPPQRISAKRSKKKAPDAGGLWQDL
jgi:GTP-binding protein